MIRALRTATALAGFMAMVFAHAARAESIPGVTELSGVLAQYHGYMFLESHRKVLDHMNRDLREKLRAVDRAEDDTVRAEASAALFEKTQTFVEFMDRYSAVVDISLPPSVQVLPRHEPAELPGDAGGILLRINPGNDGKVCAVHEWDFADGRSKVDTEPIDPAKTTYLLIDFKNVPDRITQIQLNLVTTDGRQYDLPITLRTPKKGRLKLTVLSDDTGKPAPAMVRLTRQHNGADYRPRNAIEFEPQLDSQSSQSTGRRWAKLQGKLSGNYWVVPEPADMMLPPGRWDVIIRRGTEHVAVFDSFTVKSGGVIERTYRPERWVDMRKKGWYSGDDHIHCQVLSDHDARQLMAWLQAEDVHLGNVLKMGDISRTWFEQRGFGPEFRVIDGDYILVPGQECPRTHGELGHTISLNITDMVRDTTKYYLYDWIFDNVAAQGGLSGFAHTNSGSFHVHRGMTLNIPKEQIDFIEVLQFANLGTDLFYDFLNLGYKVTASAGSDVPWGGTIGEVRVYAYTGKGKFNADKWFDAVENGRTFVTNGPMVTLDVDGAMPGDEVSLKGDGTVRVRARAWGHGDFTTPTKLQIIKHGEVIKEVTAGEEGAEELELDFEVDGGQGCWIAANVVATEGYRAHTTPVYLVREGFRFWNYAAVEGLLAARATSLDEVEQIVADATAKRERGETADDRPLDQLALQGPALLERVAESRQTYADLAQVYQQEATGRGK
jgi:hypothetical protein